MIDLTPLEVRKKKGDFRRAMRGYEPALVDDFLDVVADRLEQVVRENLSLAERVARADQQVSEYRDRERALTEALVTAQEMREEMRQQTAREVDLARRTAEQEAAQLRASAQQEVDQLRATTRAEVDALRSGARDEATQLRSTALQDREREEEAVRRLRARQQQFMSSYRAFLERELAELGVMDRTFETTATVALSAPQPPAHAAPPSSFTAPPAAPMNFALRADPSAAQVDVPVVAPVAAPVTKPVRQVDDVDTDALADAYFTESVAPLQEASLDLSLSDLDDAATFEPFEPEPFEDEPAAIVLVEEWSDDDDLFVDDSLFDDDEDVENLEDLEDELPGEDEFDDEEDELTSALLRNAAAAGYKLPDDDELLLDDAVPEEKKKKDDGWLRGLLEDKS